MKICLSCEGVTNASANRCGHCGGWLLPTDAVHYPLRRGEIDAGNPLLGTVVDGKYRLQSVLGRGGLGTVFRAQHIGSLMTVAVKLLHPRFAERPEYRRALLPEARRAATVTHERCARLLDVGEADAGIAYLAMELVEGKTLDQVLRGGPLSPSHALAILEQIAEALAAIHAVGLVHCDLSPRNVMVAPHGAELRVKVLDFGIARSVSMAGPAQSKGEFAGFVNPAFASPELLRGEDVDPRADLWSFGVLAYVLLTGTMPHDDTDHRRAAAAVLAGERRPWPQTPRLPRRVVALVQKCMDPDPARRPTSAIVVCRELALLRSARRPLLQSSAWFAAAAAVFASLAGSRSVVPAILLPVSGSPLAMVTGPLAPNHEVQCLTSSQVETLVFHCAGFAADRLRADVVRGGHPLLRTNLRPEFDAAAGTLLLSTAQPAWREVVQGLVRSSREDAIDLVFLVPGQAPLGTVRLRLDDTPPALTADLLDGDRGLVAMSVLRYQVEDAVALQAVTASLVFASGQRLEIELSRTSGDFRLGHELATRLGGVGDAGGGRLTVRATDRAGNRSESPAIEFARADVAAPRVQVVTGPAAEPFVPAVDGRVKLRLELSAPEAGCTLAIGRDGTFGNELELPGAFAVHTMEIELGAHASSGQWQFRVTDAIGNRAEQELPVVVRDRSSRVEIELDPAMVAAFRGDELVLGTQAIGLHARAGSNWNVAAVRLDSRATGIGTPQVVAVPWRSLGPAQIAFDVPSLAPGRHALVFDLQEGEPERGLRTTVVVPLRVLPSSIELVVPKARPRFLPQCVAAGVLAARGAGFVEGPGVRFDPDLRPYLRGMLRHGSGSPIALLPGGADLREPLLAEFVPTPGRNVVGFDVFDLLGRPLQVRVEDAAVAVPATGFVVADFWAATGVPELVGAELLVEHGQPARVRLRCPMPFRSDDLSDLRLELAQSDVPASSVQPIANDAALVSFDVPFLVWTVAAKLAETPREEYALQLERELPLRVGTPAGVYAMAVRLRTTRSTLLPTTLGEVAPLLPEPLRELRLLPVLAPSVPFVEPLAPDGPPRAVYRPQVAVAVRNMKDILLQDREFTWGQARALVERLPAVPPPLRKQLVHHDDPRGDERLLAANLLPTPAIGAADDDTLLGADFYQAFTLARLCGAVACGDPDAVRLPLGCELELAAFTGARALAGSGCASHGQQVPMRGFLAEGAAIGAARAAELGDVVPTPFQAPFFGLDFGAAEWVLDVPHIPGTDYVQRQWLQDHDAHLGIIEGLQRGTAEPMPDPVGPLRQFGVVRGLACGNRVGLVDRGGAPLDVAAHSQLPTHVPGVVRTEQLRRDGRDLLAPAPDLRLHRVGFRIVGVVARWPALPGGSR